MSSHAKTPSPRDPSCARKHSPWTADRNRKKTKGPSSHELEDLNESSSYAVCSPTAEAVLNRLSQFTFKKAAGSTRKSSPGGTTKRTLRRTRAPFDADVVAEALNKVRTWKLMS